MFWMKASSNQIQFSGEGVPESLAAEGGPGFRRLGARRLFPTLPEDEGDFSDLTI
jgi:hypothetical protein